MVRNGSPRFNIISESSSSTDSSLIKRQKGKQSLKMTAASTRPTLFFFARKNSSQATHVRAAG